MSAPLLHVSLTINPVGRISLSSRGRAWAGISVGGNGGRKEGSERGGLRWGGGGCFSQQCGASCEDLFSSEGSLRSTPSFFQRPRLGEGISTSNFLIMRSFSRSAVQTRPAGRGFSYCSERNCFPSLAPDEGPAGATEPVAVP